MSNKTYTPEEQKANRKLWIEALRSGKYQQGNGYLRTIDDKYCCLGVACEILGIESTVSLSGIAYFYGESKMINILPTEAAKALGINNIGQFESYNDNNNKHTSLWELNDVDQLSFNEIADFIEKNEDRLTSFFNSLD